MGRKQKRLSEEALILAYRIREARLKKYKTVKEAAELFPVEKTLWGFWETARVTPQERTMEKLSAFLDVSIDFLHQKPENWNVERKRFLAELIRRIKGFKDYYKGALPDADDGESPQRDTSDNATPLAIFLQITRLITDAQADVYAGKISRESYETHMRMIADMAKLSLYMMK